MKPSSHIVIATGIYPPEIGGPANYARELYDTLITQRYNASVITYGEIKKFPTGLRHLFYFFKLCIYAFDADYIISLDTFSVGLPAVLFARLFGKKIVTRVGGDFLWESYCERMKEPILLSEFYKVTRRYTLKERIIFRVSRLVLHLSSKVVFSTTWQRDIMRDPYRLHTVETAIIENMYPAPEYTDSEKIVAEKMAGQKVFLSPSRNIFIKNKPTLLVAFDRVFRRHREIFLDTKTVSHEVLIEKISKAYAVIVPSLSEVSPNLVSDAIRYGVPTIVTADTGMFEVLSGMSLFIDPLSVSSLEEAIERLLDPSVYAEYVKHITSFTKSRSWNQIAQEFIDVYTTL